VRLVDGAAVTNGETVTAAGRVTGAVYLGATTRVAVRLDGGGELTVLVPNSDESARVPAVDASVHVSWLRRHQHPLAG
jgi:TOBE domain